MSLEPRLHQLNAAYHHDRPVTAENLEAGIGMATPGRHPAAADGSLLGNNGWRSYANSGRAPTPWPASWRATADFQSRSAVTDGRQLPLEPWLGENSAGAAMNRRRRRHARRPVSSAVAAQERAGLAPHALLQASLPGAQPPTAVPGHLAPASLPPGSLAAQYESPGASHTPLVHRVRSGLLGAFGWGSKPPGVEPSPPSGTSGTGPMSLLVQRLLSADHGRAADFASVLGDTEDDVSAFEEGGLLAEQHRRNESLFECEDEILLYEGEDSQRADYGSFHQARLPSPSVRARSIATLHDRTYIAVFTGRGMIAACRTLIRTVHR